MIETINQIMILCGWITTVGGAIVVLTGAWKKIQKAREGSGKEDADNRGGYQGYQVKT